ncbi:hypothetical protein MKX01_003873 [Papaver californicum]|nr:hypothetical protein MKX01_003873 [Papaver californicum]
MTTSSVQRVDRPPIQEVMEEINEDTMEESDENCDKDNEEICSFENGNENGEENGDEDGVIEKKGKMVFEESEIPGQPIDPHLLCYYKDHVARLAWEISYGHVKIDRAFINAFSERWYPKTNTLHLPFGEMTPTIEDVERITGLPSTGIEVYDVYAGKRLK